MFEQNKHFVSRENYFEQIKQKLAEGYLLITGLPGVGKKQLAVEYAYRAINNNDYTIVFYISAKTEVTLRRDYCKLAAALRIPTSGKSLELIMQTVKQELQHLSASPDFAEKYPIGAYLLIFTEVSNHTYEILKRNLPQKHARGHVLLTSCYQYSYWSSIIVEPFSLEDSLALLKKQLKRYPTTSEEQERANYLVEILLGGLPLAITQAAQYINKNFTFKEYIELFEKNLLELWQREAKYKIKDYEGSVLTAFDLILEQYPKGYELLKQLSQLPDNFFDRETLSILIPNEIQRIGIMAELKHYHLLTEKHGKYLLQTIVRKVIQQKLLLETKVLSLQQTKQVPESMSSHVFTMR